MVSRLQNFLDRRESGGDEGDGQEQQGSLHGTHSLGLRYAVRVVGGASFVTYKFRAI
jgi:hypothetical protein